jgi:ABC-2 type transport system ATP-binding protein
MTPEGGMDPTGGRSGSGGSNGGSASSPAAPVIQTRSLRKVYRSGGGRRRGPGVSPFGPPATSAPPSGKEIVALVGLDLEIRSGEFFGLLGPNGAGKTTTLGILTTRVRLTSGSATVAGAEVGHQDVQVRRRIGVVPQRPNPDRALRVRENLQFHAAYFGIPRSQAAERAQALLDMMGIGDRGDSKVETLSGGQQQRLMIARALMHEPEILFLDEPTVGLDPQARLALWDVLRDLHDKGRTIVMTTHYMEEADRLCERVAIIDRGHLLALDTPARLKEQAPGGTLIELMLDGDATPAVASAGGVSGVQRAEAQGTVLRAYAARGGEAIPGLIRCAEQAGRSVHDIHLAPPSLETLFISLTGRKLD